MLPGRAMPNTWRLLASAETAMHGAGHAIAACARISCRATTQRGARSETFIQAGDETAFR